MAPQQGTWKVVVVLVLVLVTQSLVMSAEDDRVQPRSIGALCDQSVRNYRLLTPTETEAVAETISHGNCVCTMVHEAPWGAPKIQIDCTALDLQSEHLLAHNPSAASSWASHGTD